MEEAILKIWFGECYVFLNRRASNIKVKFYGFLKISVSEEGNKHLILRISKNYKKNFNVFCYMSLFYFNNVQQLSSMSNSEVKFVFVCKNNKEHCLNSEV
jgi:hypothetical protein